MRRMGHSTPRPLHKLSANAVMEEIVAKKKITSKISFFLYFLKFKPDSIDKPKDLPKAICRLYKCMVLAVTTLEVV